MEDTLIPYGKQHIDDDDINAVINVLKSDFLTQGPAVELFEKAFASKVGAKYAVAVSNGTAALHIAVLALGLKPGQKVLTTPITFAASANCIEYCDAEVDFVDINPDTGLIDLQALEARLSGNPKGTYAGIIPVDFAGLPVNMEECRRIANEHGLWIVEDACHAPGGGFTSGHGTFNFCGNCAYADTTIFSFHPVKHIACGEGGMVTTNNSDVYEKLLLLRSHGITKKPEYLNENHGGWYYDMITLGFNYRLSDIQAALGMSQLTKLDKSVDRRNELAAIYKKELKNLPLEFLSTDESQRHAYHLFIIKTKDRKSLYDYLKVNNIFAQVHYIPVHLLTHYQHKGWSIGDLPQAEQFYQECLSLPLYPSLKTNEQKKVINTIHDFFK